MFTLAPHQAMMIVINCIALALGAPGNILVLRVYLNKSRKTSTHILIMGLSLSDLISLFFTFPLEIISWKEEYYANSQSFCRLVSFFYHFFAQCSVLITVAIAIDRYYAVCRPHQWKITNSRVNLVLGACFGLSSLTSVAAIFSYGVKKLDIEASSVYYYESADQPEKTNITFCHRDVSSGFHLAVFIVHAIWFIMLFVVLIAAYLKIYLTIRKRVNAGSVSDGDTSRMRVVRPAIRFISHLNIVTNRAGTAGNNSKLQTEVTSPDQDDREEYEPDTHSTDDSSSHSAGKSLEETARSHWLQHGTSKPLTGKSNNAVACAFLVAGGIHRPVQPSVSQAGEQSAELNESPGPNDKNPPPTLPKSQQLKRKASAWNKLSAAAAVTASHSETGPASDDTSSEAGGRSGDPRVQARGPFSKVLQKRSLAATALNLKIQKKTTNMLLVAALAAVVTWFPTLIIELAIPNVHEMIIMKPELVKIVICIMGWLFLFNFVTNPIVYSLMNDRFREECSKSFPKCMVCCKKKITVQRES